MSILDDNDKMVICCSNGQRIDHGLVFSTMVKI